MLSCAQSIISLRGITQKSTFELINNNQNLAVVFQIFPTTSIPIQIEPKRGIILQQQHTKIKVWVVDQYKQKALTMNWINEEITINCTLNTEYNRRVFEKLELRGWDKAKNSAEQIRIPITMSPDALKIRSQIQSEESHSISEGMISRGRLFNQSNEMRSMSRKKVSKKLDKQLDYLFETERMQDFRSPKPSKFHQERYKSPSSSLRKPTPLRPSQQSFQHRQNVQSRAFSHRTRNSRPPHIRPPQISENNNNQRVVQLIILAALAGFFAALGSNLKLIFI